MDLGLIAAPKSANLGRIAAIIDIFDFSLTAEEVDAITALDTGSVPPVDSDEPLSPPPGIVESGANQYRCSGLLCCQNTSIIVRVSPTPGVDGIQSEMIARSTVAAAPA